MPSPDDPRIFVSYARSDGLDFVRELQAVLQGAGLSLYRDLPDLEGGQDWWRQVEAAIKAVEHVVLVLSPDALKSRYVRDEWKLARQYGKSVWPVSGPGTLDFSDFPRWMARASRHDIAIPESRDRLILGLKGPSQQRRVPFMADALPAGFVPRPDKLDQVKRRLLDAKGDSIPITAALRGAGGFGKTVIANALSHDPEVQEAFDGGILRVTLGEQSTDLVGMVADLIVILTNVRPDVTSLDAAKTKLAEALDDRRCLLVIDDVWRLEDLEPFLHRGLRDQTTRLITTRDDRVLPPEAERIAVDAMTSAQALDMLVQGLPTGTLQAHRPSLAALAARLGEWPLLLGLTSRVLQNLFNTGSMPESALDYVARSLEQRGIDGTFRTHGGLARRATVEGTLDLSLEQLPEKHRPRFAELVIFEEDAEIPIPAAIGLWRQTADLGQLDAEDLLTRLNQLSLLIDYDTGKNRFRLHDVFRDLMRSPMSVDQLKRLDRSLMAHFSASCGNDLTGLTDIYGLRHAIRHLRRGENAEAADRLLLDAGWMRAKITILGTQHLLADYAGQPRLSAAGMIGATLTLAANALARRPAELPIQLIARLSPSDAPGLEGCLATARSRLTAPALVPSHPTFTPPGAELRRFEGHHDSVTSIALLADGRRVLSGSADNTLRLWDLETGAELRRFEGHHDSVTSVALLTDGRRALSGSADRTLRLWDLETGAELRRFEGHQGKVTNVAVLAGGRHALSGSDEYRPWLWDIDTGVGRRGRHGSHYAIRSLALLADGKRALWSCWQDRALRLLDVEALFDVESPFAPTVGPRRFEGHEHGVTSVAVQADGRRALSGSEDKTLCLWDVDTGAHLASLKGHQGKVTSLAMLADGGRAVSGSEDKTLRLWDLASGTQLRCFEGHQDEVTSVAVLANGRQAVSGSNDRTLRLWDLDSVTEVRRVQGHIGRVTSVIVLADGRRAVSASKDSTLLWDLETGAQPQPYAQAPNLVVRTWVRSAMSGRHHSPRHWHIEDIAECYSVLSDRRRILSGSADDKDNALLLWDLESGDDPRRFEGHLGKVTSVAALDDEQRALSGSADNTLRLWDLKTGVELRSFEGHMGTVTSIAALSDGRRALSGSADKTVRLWDLAAGTELGRFDGHHDTIVCIAASTNLHRAFTGSNDNTLRLWDLDTGAEMTALTFDAAPTALAWSTSLGAVVVGDALGRVHTVRLIE